jgi:hypothetical protein
MMLKILAASATLLGYCYGAQPAAKARTVRIAPYDPMAGELVRCEAITHFKQKETGREASRTGESGCVFRGVPWGVYEVEGRPRHDQVARFKGLCNVFEEDVVCVVSVGTVGDVFGSITLHFRFNNVDVGNLPWVQLSGLEIGGSIKVAIGCNSLAVMGRPRDSLVMMVIFSESRPLASALVNLKDFHEFTVTVKDHLLEVVPYQP